MFTWKFSSPRVMKATMREICILVSSSSCFLPLVYLNLSKMMEPGMEVKMNILRKI